MANTATNKVSIAIVAAFAGFLVSSSHATVFRVDGIVAQPGGGQDWDSAFKFLQDALLIAEPLDTILVAEGTYRPDENMDAPTGSGSREATFVLGNNLTILVRQRYAFPQDLGAMADHFTTGRRLATRWACRAGANVAEVSQGAPPTARGAEGGS